MLTCAAEWQEMYQPSKEQAEADRAQAYERNMPHGELDFLKGSLEV